ncbi:hypothetical protein [Richelia sinica]|uniref:hypothetical protein n=1 Tax=Richelia sinica TaxID=1357545 RepID=UPI001687D0FD|nr:hypothetical protein [Richelia sinica]
MITPKKVGKNKPNRVNKDLGELMPEQELLMGTQKKHLPSGSKLKTIKANKLFC